MNVPKFFNTNWARQRIEMMEEMKKEKLESSKKVRILTRLDRKGSWTAIYTGDSNIHGNNTGLSLL
jgi:hypothetical protein